MATQIRQRSEAHRSRVARYYPLELPFSYTALRHGHVIRRGFGETTEISSTRIRIKPLENLNLATSDLVVSITWPAKLKDGTPLQFVSYAKPHWAGSELVELHIRKHEFRTASKGNLGLGLRIGFGAVKAPHSEPAQEESLSFRPFTSVAALGA